MSETTSLYSSVCIGNGAVGAAPIFNRPQGQEIPFLGSGNRNKSQMTYSKLTTNLMQASEANGVIVGDFTVRNVEVVGIGSGESDWDPVGMFLMLTLDGKEVLSGPIHDFLDGGYVLKEPIVVGRLSCLEGVVEVVPGRVLDVRGPPFLLTVFLSARGANK